MTRPLGGPRIDFVQVLDDASHRTMETVQVQTVESRAPVLRPFRILRAQPAQEPHDLTVPPHPARKSREIRERVLSGVVSPEQPNPLIAAVRVGPVRFGCDQIESALSDQGTRKVGANPIELQRSMCGFPKQHQ